ncbi:ubiquinone/menaquinone biosynthesis methyltransferase [Citrobacter freundii]|nr:ubiquinone/menaquinone biosynthesis methyltransferase [Citrobacter freundii]
MVDNSQETTHFGFQTVAKEQKADMVAHVFHSVASKYDVMNDLMSFGIHRLWKRFTIDCSGVRRGQTVLDLAGGDGRSDGEILSYGRRNRQSGAGGYQ